MNKEIDMGTINTIKNGTLYLDFRYRGKRCKEYTRLKNNPANRRRLAKILDRIEAEITLGTFNYGNYFPDSKRVADFGKELECVEVVQRGIPSFESFSATWHAQKQVEWRETVLSRGWRVSAGRSILVYQEYQFSDNK
jgi:integrase